MLFLISNFLKMFYHTFPLYRQLRCVVKKNETNLAELAEILSSFAVDLSVSDRLQHPEAATAAACENQNRVANLSGSSEIVDNGASGCNQPTRVAAASAAVVDETFLRPLSHSTPIRDLPCGRNSRLSYSTGDESDDRDDNEEVNDFFIGLLIIF